MELGSVIINISPEAAKSSMPQDAPPRSDQSSGHENDPSAWPRCS
jgi:hypothetical protein